MQCCRNVKMIRVNFTSRILGHVRSKVAGTTHHDRMMMMLLMMMMMTMTMIKMMMAMMI